MATSSTSAYARHLQRASSYVRFYGGAAPPAPIFRSEREILEQNHRFIRDDDTPTDLDEEKRLAKRYYDSLFREYALVDLSRWREQKIALRWRTKAEVLAGQGQFTCGCLSCSRRHRNRHDRMEELKTFELNFAYMEDGLKKNSLVKVCVCRKCSKKLRRAQKSDDREAGYSQHKRKRRHSDSCKRSNTTQLEPEDGIGDTRMARGWVNRVCRETVDERI